MNTVLVAELQEIPLFSALPEKALAVLAARGTLRTLPVGTEVFGEGEASLALFVVLTGEVELRRTHDGRCAVVGVRHAGEWFGEVGLIGIKRRGVVATVRRPSRVLEIAARELLDLYERDVDAYALLSMNIARELARKLDRLEQAFVAAQPLGGG